MRDGDKTTASATTASAAMPDEFDRAWGELDGLKNAGRTKPAQIIDAPPFGIGGTRTFMITTVRERQVKDGQEDKARPRFTVFLQRVSADGGTRLVLPPDVCDVIARQRDALTAKARKKTAKRAAETRKARRAGRPKP